MKRQSLYQRLTGKSYIEQMGWWARIKRLQPSPGRYFHVSQKIVETPKGPKLVGVTYNIGRNKAKRQAREVAKFRLVAHG